MAGSEGHEGVLVDFDTGVVRRDRLLVQRRPGMVLFLGFGSRARRLLRFAGNEAPDPDPDPFIARCRRIALAVEGGSLAKAQDEGVPRAVLDIEDRAVRRLAIAEALAKAGFNVNEPRVPAGNPGGGEWTVGGGERTVEAGVEPAAFRTENVQAKKERFVDAHLADAQKAADKLKVPVENILGLSALESNWGEARFARQGNNYFGIHYPAPLATGYLMTLDGRVKVATFKSYADSLRSFVQEAGSVMQDQSDPVAFASALQNSGKFGINPGKGARVPTYVDRVAATIRGLRSIVARRLP